MASCAVSPMPRAVIPIRKRRKAMRSAISRMRQSAFSRATTGWPNGCAADPYKGPDAVLGLGLLLTLDVKNGRRPDPVIDEDFEWPEEH